MVKNVFQDYDVQKTDKWFKDENGKSFLSYLRYRLMREQGALEASSDLLMIGRAQGKIEILKWILNSTVEEQ
jgi:hypothetical protein